MLVYILLKYFRISTSSKEVGGETKRNSQSSTWWRKEHECAELLFIVLTATGTRVLVLYIYLPSPLVHSIWRNVHAYVFVMNDCISRMILLHILFLKSVHYLIMWPLLGRFLCMYVLFDDQYVIICTGNVDLWIVHYLYFCSVLQCIMYQC